MERGPRLCGEALSSPGWGRLLSWLAWGVSGYAVVAYALLPLGSTVHPAMRLSYLAHAPAIYLHVFASSLALATGPFQFSGRLRAARPGLHRWMGRAYLVVGVGLGGLCGLYMAAHAHGGPVAACGFAVLALAWLFTGYRAFGAIRAGDQRAHRRWMWRNYALTLAAVSLRLELAAALLVSLPFDRSYPVVAWLSWLPNGLLAECLLRRRVDVAGTRWP